MVHDARTKLMKKIYTNPEIVTKLEDLTKAKIVRIFSDINIEEDIAMTELYSIGHLIPNRIDMT